jgi:O-antigen ligase
MGWIVAALGFAVLFFMPGLLQEFDVPKIEAVRVCGLGALAAGLVGGLAGRPRRWRALDVAVVAWLAVEGIATVLSRSPRLSVLGEPRQREGLLTSLALAGLFFAARDAFARPARMRAVLAIGSGLAGVAALYALAQVGGHDWMQWRREAVYAGGYVRPFATLGHPNLLGVVVASAAAAALALALTARGIATRVAFTLMALITTVVTVLTLSRAAWLAAGVALPLAALLAVRGRGGSSRGALGAATGAVLVLALGALLATRAAPVAGRLGESTEGGSAASRVEIWKTALAAWKARPLTGQGPDLFELVFPRYQTPDYWRLEWAGLPAHAHSIYLHTLATRGVLGALAGLAWVLAFVIGAARAWRRRADGAGVLGAALAMTVAIAIAGAFGAIGISGALLLVLASAMIASLETAEGVPPAPAPGPRPERGRGRDERVRTRGSGARSARPARRGPRPRAWVAALAGATVAVMAFLWGFAELRASRAASAAQAWMTRDPADGAAAAAYATTLGPHEDRLWRMLAETLLWRSALGDTSAAVVDQAIDAARRAVRLEDERAENHVILARALGVRASRGAADSAEVRAEFDRALALAPMDALTLMERADGEALAGHGDRALPPARRVVALYPREGAAHATLARAWLAAGARDSARAEIGRALAAVWRDSTERRNADALRDDLDRPIR